MRSSRESVSIGGSFARAVPGIGSPLAITLSQCFTRTEGSRRRGPGLGMLVLCEAWDGNLPTQRRVFLSGAGFQQLWRGIELDRRIKGDHCGSAPGGLKLLMRLVKVRRGVSVEPIEG